MKKRALANLLLCLAGSAVGQEVLEAVKAGDLDKVRLIVERDPKIVNMPNPNGETILFAAIVLATAVTECGWCVNWRETLYASATESEQPIRISTAPQVENLCIMVKSPIPHLRRRKSRRVNADIMPVNPRVGHRPEVRFLP